MLSRMHLKKSPVLFALGLIVTACKVGPDYHKPQMEMPGAFSEIGAATMPDTRSATWPSSQPGAMDVPAPDYRQWWTNFNDPELDSLIGRAMKNNPTLAAAEARIREARGNYGVALSGLFPAVNAQGEYSHSRTPPAAFGAVSGAPVGGAGGFGGNPFVSDFWQAGFDASWEIDVFGGTRRAMESADALVQAAVEDRRDVMISLFS